ncbi:MAG TPA: uroporphyrinogen-III C-methyltransferase [Chitinophagaceae bacterium]|nr:uroporphyrinogen-III C-methyltransferase [Chitinophagaceae bacterium]
MKNKSLVPGLYIVGAGPGDPELITVKALRVIERADVILYDNLANVELLEFAPKECLKIYVGKKPYGDYTHQDKIHELIEENASKGIVVRLKGGDPFIFGRGFEEILFARNIGMEAFYIPGITSMQAVGLENIPLTHRNICESIWVVTGTKKDGSLTADLRLAIKSRATIVVYMGMKKLAEIAHVFVEEGEGNLPAAIIQHVSLPKQKMSRGKVKDLVDMAENAALTHPSIIIIGDVVAINQP